MGVDGECHKHMDMKRKRFECCCSERIPNCIESMAAKVRDRERGDRRPKRGKVRDRREGTEYKKGRITREGVSGRGEQSRVTGEMVSGRGEQIRAVWREGCINQRRGPTHQPTQEMGESNNSEPLT